MTESDWIKVAMSVLGLIGGVLIAILKGLSMRFERLVKSVEDLNINVAVIVVKVNSHEKRIERLEEDE